MNAAVDVFVDATDIEEQEGEILGTFGIIIQLLLGFMSFMALVVKRGFENPKRPLIIWFLDTSKQAFSALLAHFINMVLAMMLSANTAADDGDWYFINLCFDVCVGVFLGYVILMIIEQIAMYYDISMLNTGNYVKLNYEGDYILELEPTKQTEVNNIDYKIWFVQIIVWGMIVVAAKTVLFFIQFYFAPYLELAAYFVIGWLDKFPNAKLVLIMVIIPLILNSIQFWIQDNILKGKKSKTIEFCKHYRHRRNKSVFLGNKIEMEFLPHSRRTKTIFDPRQFLRQK